MSTQSVDGQDSGYNRLEDQINWYDQKSIDSQKKYKAAKLAAIICAASVAIVANHYPVAASIIGSAIVVLESIQQLNQWHTNWVSYRSTCEALRHEKFCYIEKAGPYVNCDSVQAKMILVERVESLISTENSKWTKIISGCNAKTNTQEGKK